MFTKNIAFPKIFFAYKYASCYSTSLVQLSKWCNQLIRLDQNDALRHWLRTVRKSLPSDKKSKFLFVPFFTLFHLYMVTHISWWSRCIADKINFISCPFVLLHIFFRTHSSLNKIILSFWTLSHNLYVQDVKHILEFIWSNNLFFMKRKKQNHVTN